MANVALSNVMVNGLACAVPDHRSTIANEYPDSDPNDIEKICKSTGVWSRFTVLPGQCTSDLCYVAARKLLKELNWLPETVDILILVTQTSDYILPATACTLQQRLGLSNGCSAFDVNLGCSGYVYGLWMMSSLLSAGKLRRGLLLVGDTISRICSPQDRSTNPLFGDAGTATAIEWNDRAPAMHFQFGTDGSGSNHLIVPAGGFRHPRTASTNERRQREGSNIRSNEDLFMNGAEIFTFTLKRLPPLISGIMASVGWSVDDVDAFVMHQANSFMIKHLAKKMKLPPEKVLITLEEYGNTSSASIPLAMHTKLLPNLSKKECKLVLAGFGVGYSWAAVALKLGPIVMPNLVKTDHIAIS